MLWAFADIFVAGCGVENPQTRKEVNMDNNSTYVQDSYRASGVNRSSSTAAGQAEARLGVQCAGQQHNESHDAYQNRVQAYNAARQSSGR